VHRNGTTGRYFCADSANSYPFKGRITFDMAQKKAATKKASSKQKSGGRKRSTSAASNEVRTEMHHLKQGEHKSAKQAIAIGLSKARRKGKDVPPPKKGTTSAATRKKAERDSAAGRSARQTHRSTGSTKRASAKKSSGRKTATKTTSRKSSAKRSR
jgi:hypothetical protein